MINYINVLYSVSKLLCDNFPDIRIGIDENKEEIKTSYLYIQIVPLSNNERLSDKRLKLTDMYITYVKKDANTTQRLDIIDDICETLDTLPIYAIKNKKPNGVIRYLPVIDKKITNVKDPTVKFTFKYYDDKRDPHKNNPSEYYEGLMEIINTRIEAKPLKDIEKIITN